MSDQLQRMIEVIMEREGVDARTAEMMLEIEAGGDVVDEDAPVARDGLSLAALVGKQTMHKPQDGDGPRAAAITLRSNP